MKKLGIMLLVLVMILSLVACAQSGASEPVSSETSSSMAQGENVVEVTTNGYGGEMVVKVSMNNGEVTGIEVTSHHETEAVFNRALPVLEERILEAQSPVVDSVSGATMSSYAIKSAVAEAFKQAGQDFGEINVNTAPEHAEPQQLEDVSTDLVIVGGGPAGLATAITAKQSGVENVILVEKMDILGGNGKFNMNFTDLYHSQAKVEAGTDMTKEEFLEAKSAIDSEERMNRWADVAYDLDAWLRDLGIELNYTYDTYGHMAEADKYAGDYLVTILEEQAYAAGVDIRTGTKGTDLIMEDGKAVGVSVENQEGYYNINAKAVVIATGGFVANDELIAEYAPSGVGYNNSNQIGATGDFIPVFLENNIQLASMDKLTMITILYPRRDVTGGADLAFTVDSTGAVAEQNNETNYYITDSTGYDSFYRIRKHVDAGYYVTADTLEELAEALGVDYAGLQATIDAYNAQEDIERPFDAEGPYYGAAVQRAIHMTRGGVLANENSEVLDNNNQVVPGLYAAGEVCATSAQFSGSIVFGQIAATEAAEYISAQ